MSDIWIDEYSSLKSYRASAKGSKSLVTVEIECTDPSSLGWLLKSLGEITQRQERAAAEAKAGRAAAKKKQLALPAPALQICDMRGDRS